MPLLRGLCATLALLAGTLTLRSAERPNILLILSDDMGYSDIGCYGGEISTPNLDRLAAEGVRFTQFYNGARCCPTRASLLTGVYPHQADMGFMVRRVNVQGYHGDLSHQAVTIAEVLHASGYYTAMAGKWHIARSHTTADVRNWPVQRGFDRFYGTIRGFGSFWDPETLTRQNRFISPLADPEYKPEGTYYYTDAISDNAIAYLKESAASRQPFFLYVAYTTAHWPLHAPESDIAKYQGKYDAGYAAVRNARMERLRKLGLMDEPWQGAPTVGNWDAVQNRRWEARCMETYAAMIDHMDQGIGRIVAQLKADGRLDNTLVLFLQDNGACAEPTARKPFDQAGPNNPKPMRPDELQTRCMPPMQTRDGRVVKSGTEIMAGPADSFVSYGENWANVSNTPFREYKHWVHEGGISTPLIVRWPAGVPAARRGALERQPGHIIDIMATCVDVAGARYPTEFNGQKITPIEGVSLVPALQGRPLGRKQPLFWEHESNRAVRDGQWKLVAMEDKPWELYDLTTDRTEMHDLSGTHPDKVRELAAAWEAWAQRAHVLPLGSWKPVWGTPGKESAVHGAAAAD